MPSLPIETDDGWKREEAVASRRKMLWYIPLIVGIFWTAYSFFPHKTAVIMSDLGSPSSAVPEILTTRPHRKDVVKVEDLPRSFVPGTGRHRHGGRLVVVGDVHGMKDSLLHLLSKLDFNKKHDHLILAGDMISKGPDSKGVVDLVMKLGATGLRGNHEDRIIETYTNMLAAGIDVSELGAEDFTLDSEAEATEMEAASGSSKDRRLVKILGRRRIEWLSNCPVILRVGKLEGMGHLVVVHAGLLPGVKLEKQDPESVMNMRTIDKHGQPSAEHDGKAWRKAWNKHQKTLRKEDRTTVIYGHDSKRGLQEKKYSIGIDTGCLKGGKLTAVVIEGGHDDHTYKLVHVNCKDGREGK